MSKVRCKNCKEYLDKDDSYSAGLSSFCDYECFSDFSRKRNETALLRQREKRKDKPKSNRTGRPSNHKRVPKSHPPRLDKPSKVDYGRISPETHRAVLRADRRCRVCESTDNLQVHHIVYRSESRWFWWCSTPQNLITLCINCHIPIVHKDKKRWQKVMLGLVWLREVEGNTSMNAYEFEEWIGNEP